MSIYRTSGTLTTPVSDLSLAREYLQQHDMTEFVDHSLQAVVDHIEWDLLDEGNWKVVVVTNRPLTAEESAALSQWISGQNSDGLGEGFEQQAFAEHFETDRYGDMDEESYCMSSFDWETNNCELTLVK